MKAVILCGGGGTRLWPLSRKSKPKQFHRLVKNYSLLQDTIMRLSKVVAMEDIYISTNEEFVDEIKFQLFEIPEENIITEPSKRDNAPAIGLALTHILTNVPSAIDETIVFLPADHLFENETKFADVMKQADEACRHHPSILLTLGVRPTYPATVYGYIKMTPKEIDKGVFAVEEFVEKPPLEQAKQYASAWEYMWNVGIFAATGKHFQYLYQTYLPRTWDALQHVATSIGTNQYEQSLKEQYEQTEKISFDYGIVEKTPDIALIPTDNLGWTDIGNWNELKRVLKETADDQGNIIYGNAVTEDCKNSLVYAQEKKVVAVFGLENIVVVDTPDALLVMPAERAADVKDVVEAIKQKTGDEYM